MKKILIFMILLFIANNITAQRNWFTPKQRATIDSLFQIVDTLGLSGFSSLAYGKFYIGSATGVATARTISGPVTISYLGVSSIENGSITNAMIETDAGITVNKIGGGSVDNTEFSYLNGVTSNIQTQINNINVGTGYLLATGDVVEGELDYNDNVSSNYGGDADLVILHNSIIPENSIYSTNADLNIMQTDANNILFSTNSIERFKINSSGAIIPSITATIDLGSKTYRFKDIYPTTIHFRNAQNSDSPSGSILDIPSYLVHPTSGWYHNQVYTLSQDFYYDYNGDVASKNGFYLLDYYDENPLAYIYIPDSTEIQDMVSKRLNYNSVVAMEAATTDSIDFSNTNNIHSHLKNMKDNVTLYLKNYGPGLTQKVIIDIESDYTITCSFGAINKYWGNNTEIEITDTGRYIMWFSYLNDDDIQIDWNYYGPVK